jgi:protein gp37
MVFVNSMSDLFQKGVPATFIEHVARVMQMANWHTYQLLTKRAENMRDMLRGPLAFAADLPNVWWGVSVEDKKYGLPRIDALRAASAAVRFLSIEPLLEDLGKIDLSGIHWVIVGGESGPGARPLEARWVRSIREQCEAAGVPFFFKQWGGVRKSETGRTLDGRTYDAMPERPAMPVAARDWRTRMVDHVREWQAKFEVALTPEERSADLQSADVD